MFSPLIHVPSSRVDPPYAFKDSLSFAVVASGFLAGQQGIQPQPQMQGKGKQEEVGSYHSQYSHIPGAPNAAIFWDLENCPVPKPTTLQHVLVSLRNELEAEGLRADDAFVYGGHNSLRNDTWRETFLEMGWTYINAQRKGRKECSGRSSGSQAWQPGMFLS